MPTNEEIQNRIIEAIKKKTGNRVIDCPICGHKSWQIGVGYMTLGSAKHPTEQQMGGNMYPNIPMICNNCGNTRLINLLVLGFTEADFNSIRFT